MVIGVLLGFWLENHLFDGIFGGAQREIFADLGIAVIQLEPHDIPRNIAEHGRRNENRHHEQNQNSLHQFSSDGAGDFLVGLRIFFQGFLLERCAENGMRRLARLPSQRRKPKKLKF